MARFRGVADRHEGDSAMGEYGKTIKNVLATIARFTVSIEAMDELARSQMNEIGETFSAIT